MADDSATLWTMLDTAADVIVVAGNAGHELLADLVLIDHLLARDQARSVSLHVKLHPSFVSDATTGEAVACLHWLTRTAATTEAGVGSRSRRNRSGSA